MSGKLKNIQTIRQFLDGTHRKQTKTHVGWKPSAPIKREIGEKWLDEESGQMWEQKEGYRVKHGKMDELRDLLHMPYSCPKCNNPMTKRLDKKFYFLHKMCLDCNALEETHMKINGTYKEYEQSKMRENAKSWLQDAARDKEILKAVLLSNTFVNADGTLEKWSLPESPEVMCKRIDEEFEKFATEFKGLWNIKDFKLTDEATK